MANVWRFTGRSVFILAVLGGLGFGGSRALASMSPSTACTEPGEVSVSTCPPDGECGCLCETGVGLCRNGCCTCAL